MAGGWSFVCRCACMDLCPAQPPPKGVSSDVWVFRRPSYNLRVFCATRLGPSLFTLIAASWCRRRAADGGRWFLGCQRHGSGWRKPARATHGDSQPPPSLPSLSLSLPLSLSPSLSVSLPFPSRSLPLSFALVYCPPASSRSPPPRSFSLRLLPSPTHCRPPWVPRLDPSRPAAVLHSHRAAQTGRGFHFRGARQRPRTTGAVVAVRTTSSAAGTTLGRAVC